MDAARFDDHFGTRAAGSEGLQPTLSSLSSTDDEGQKLSSVCPWSTGNFA